MPLLSTLYFVGTAMFDYFEVNLWLALYGVCIEAKQVIIKNKIKCCKNTNHGVGLLDLRLTFSPLVTGHFSCSEWDHSHMSVTVFHLYLFWEGKVVVIFFGFFYCFIESLDWQSIFYPQETMTLFLYCFNAELCLIFFNDFFPHQVFQVTWRKVLLLKAIYINHFSPPFPLTCDHVLKVQPKANYVKGAAETTGPLEARSGPQTEGRIT